jgi:SRSO17 transposase
MDAAAIRRLGPMLDRFLAHFDDCFSRRPTREHLAAYVRGLLSDLPRKSAEPIALDQDVPVRTLQEFLGAHRWDHGRLRDRLQQLIARDHADPHSVGTLDDCGCPKKGDKTPGVQRQYCGATGKVDNCVVTVHLGYAAGDFHCLLDSELYLPESWDADRRRCRAAGIPDEVAYRAKWEIALELYDRAVANGVRFAWLTFDEGYGGKPGLLRGLRQRRQRYVAEVPGSFSGWLHLPALTDAGRWADEPARAVGELLTSDPLLAGQPWVAYRVKEGHKGPMVWEAKHAVLFPKREDGDPGWPVHLVVARYALDHAEVKFFVSNAPPEAATATLLLVGFSRWRIERCFEDGKTELGLDHFEGRSYTGLIRHQRLVGLAHLFCARVCERWGEKRPRADGVPGEGRAERVGAVVGTEAVGPVGAAGQNRGEHPAGAAAQRGGAALPREEDPAEVARGRHQAHLSATVPMELKLAL